MIHKKRGGGPIAKGGRRKEQSQLSYLLIPVGAGFWPNEQSSTLVSAIIRSPAGYSGRAIDKGRTDWPQHGVARTRVANPLVAPDTYHPSALDSSGPD